MNQDNLDAGIVTNSVVVSATSPVGVTTARIEEGVEIERESSLAVGKNVSCGRLGTMYDETTRWSS